MLRPRIQWLIALYLVLALWQWPLSYLSPSWRAQDFVGMVIGVAFLGGVVTWRLYPRSCAPPLLLLFFAVVLFNYLRSGVEPPFTERGGVTFLQFMGVLGLLFTLMFGAVLFSDAGDRRLLYSMLAFGAAAVLVDGWLRWFGVTEGFFLFRGQAGHIFQTAGHIRFGQMGTEGYFLFLYILSFGPGKRIADRAIWTSLAACCVLSVILSGGRALVGAMILALVVRETFAALDRPSEGITLRWMIIIGVLLAFITALEISGMRLQPILDTVNPRITDREHFLKSMGTFGGSGSGRLSTWYTSCRLIRRAPLWGTGPLPSALYRREPGRDAIFHAHHGTHATYFNIAAIHGLPALMLYVLGVTIPVLRLLRCISTLDPGSFERRSAFFVALFLTSSLFRFLWEGGHVGGDWRFYLMLSLADGAVAPRSQGTEVESKNKQIGSLP